MSSGIGAIEQPRPPFLPLELLESDTLFMDDLTNNLTDGRSFEERVFARFDAMDARFNAMERRLDVIEHRLDVIENRLDVIDDRLGREAAHHSRS